MADIDIIDEQNFLKDQDKEMLLDLIELTSRVIQSDDDFEMDISIVNNQEIHQLNLDYRGIDRPTDVLSFALEEQADEADIFDMLLKENGVRRHLGDLIISYEKVQEQAEDYKHSIERELGFLVVHGFLHLNGYDHQTVEEEAKMFSIQEEVLSKYGLSR